MRASLNSLIFLVAISQQLLYAQQDTLFYKNFTHDHNLTLGVRSQFPTLEYESDDKTYSFKPNKPLSIASSFSWRNSSFSFAQDINSTKDKNMGKSKIIDFQFNNYGKKYYLNFAFQQYKGFSLPTETSTAYLHFDQLAINIYSANFTYVFNGDKYSIGAAFNRNEQQIKSAGSLLIGGVIFFSSLKNPPIFTEEINDYNKKNLSFGPNIGYTYNFVIWRNFLFSPSFTIGLNGIVDKNMDTKNTRLLFNTHLAAKFSIIYQHQNWGIGFTSSIQSFYLNKVAQYDTQITNAHVMFSVNRRFSFKRTPKIFQYDFQDIFKSTN